MPFFKTPGHASRPPLLVALLSPAALAAELLLLLVVVMERLATVGVAVVHLDVLLLSVLPRLLLLLLLLLVLVLVLLLVRILVLMLVVVLLLLLLRRRLRHSEARGCPRMGRVARPRDKKVQVVRHEIRDPSRGMTSRDAGRGDGAHGDMGRGLMLEATRTHARWVLQLSDRRHHGGVVVCCRCCQGGRLQSRQRCHPSGRWRCRGAGVLRRGTLPASVNMRRSRRRLRVVACGMSYLVHR